MAKAKKKRKDAGYRTAVSGAKGVIRILLYICLAVVLIFLGREAYVLGYEVFDEKPVDESGGREITISITEDMSVMDVGELLNERGLIDERPLAFWIQEHLSEYHGDILPGIYILNTSQTVEEMLEIMAQVNTEGQPEQEGSGSSSGDDASSGSTSSGSTSSGSAASDGTASGSAESGEGGTQQ